jgi:hypothetical protein
MRLEPDNLELKAFFIRKAFETDVWKAYTEVLRFEALAEQKMLLTEGISQEDTLKLRGEVE